MDFSSPPAIYSKEGKSCEEHDQGGLKALKRGDRTVPKEEAF